MVGIMYTDKKADAESFYKRTGATWPILNDDGSTALTFGVTGVPETYVVSPERSGRGQVRGGHHRVGPRRRDPALRR